ncbi:ATP synthase delta chain [Xylaria cf. heliscus]|nr:ATP synthase delta chain [Xylaria cf. heliscus]
MNALRVARAALRARPAAMRLPIQTLQRRGYADAAPDKAHQAKLVSPSPGTIASSNAIASCLPSVHHSSHGPSIYTSQDVVQVNIPAESGEMGVLANHVPSIEQLKPGLVEIIEENGASKQYFLSGGFATVQPNSVLSINAVEGYPLEDFSAEAVRSQIAEAQKVASGSGSEQDIAEAKIELEVLESLQAVLK